MNTVQLYTDGGSHGNPGEGAWAFCVVRTTDEKPTCGSGYERYTTNNRMELRAVIEGLRFVIGFDPNGSVEVRTDSEYVRKGITEWIVRWKKNGWQTSARKPVKNAELWRELDELDSQLRTEWRWVKGHSGEPLNEMCDALVQSTIAQRSGASNST